MNKLILIIVLTVASSVVWAQAKDHRSYAYPEEAATTVTESYSPYNRCPGWGSDRGYRFQPGYHMDRQGSSPGCAQRDLGETAYNPYDLCAQWGRDSGYRYRPGFHADSLQSTVSSGCARIGLRADEGSYRP